MSYKYNPFTNSFDEVGGGANTSLSNLTSTSINQPLVTAINVQAEFRSITDLATTAVIISSGDATGQSGESSGNVLIATGATDISSGGNSGAIVLATSPINGGGTGNIFIQDGSQGNPGDILASRDTQGAIVWTNPAGLGNIKVVAVSDSNINVSNPGTNVFDGVTLATNDYLYLVGQSDQTENGVYNFQTAGTPLQRSVPKWTTGLNITPLNNVYVRQGNVYRNTTWTANTSLVNVVIGTDPLVSVINGFNPFTIGFNLIPSGSNNYDLGDAGNNWNNVHTSQVNADTTNLTVYSSLGVTVQANTNPLNLITSNQSGTTSSILITTGNSDTDTTGDISLITGVAVNDSGALDIESGHSTAGNSGTVNLTSGDSDTANSGNIALTTGAATGTRGSVQINALTFNFPSAAADPTGTFVGGESYYNTTTGKFRGYNGISLAWENLN